MSKQKSSNVKSSIPSQPDSIYSRSYQYKKPNGQQSSRNRKLSKSPVPKKSPKKATKAPAQRKPSGSTSRKPKSGAPDLKTSEKDLREILEMYFEYIIENLVGKTNKIFGISVGKFLTKTIFEKEKAVDITVSDISFQINRSKVAKDFRVCDLIDFTFHKQRGKVNLYLIREILIKFDYSGKTDRIEKQDDTLPDIEIKFKVHPIIQKSTTNNYEESLTALQHIQDTIDPDFNLDNHGVVGLFETGHRKEDDERLHFENFAQSL